MERTGFAEFSAPGALGVTANVNTFDDNAADPTTLVTFRFGDSTIWIDTVGFLSLPGGLRISREQQLSQQSVLDTSTLHEHLEQEIRKAQEASAIQIDKHRMPTPTYKIGDKVWLSSRHIKTTRSTKKLDHRYFGPFEISEKISPHAYCLGLPKSMPIHSVFHVQLLFPYVQNQQSSPSPV